MKKTKIDVCYEINMVTFHRENLSDAKTNVEGKLSRSNLNGSTVGFLQLGGVLEDLLSN